MQFAAQSAKTALAVQLSFFPITRTITITAAPDHLLLILIQNREPRLVIIACMSITYTPARSNLDRNCIPAVEQFQIVPEAAEATPKKKTRHTPPTVKRCLVGVALFLLRSWRPARSSFHRQHLLNSY